MGSIGVTDSGRNIVVSSPGTVRFSNDYPVSNPLENDEMRVLQNDKDFNFEVRKMRSGAPGISIRNSEGDEIALAISWYDSVEVHNRFTGTEYEYKNLRTALSGVRRQYNNMQNRRNR